MSLYRDGHPRTGQHMQAAIRDACVSNKLFPVLCGSSLNRIGVEQLMDAMVAYLPSSTQRISVGAHSVDKEHPVSVCIASDAPFVAYALKITYDRHRGRHVHLRAITGSLPDGKMPMLITTQGQAETPTKLLRVIADRFVDIENIATSDVFAADVFFCSIA